MSDINVGDKVLVISKPPYGNIEIGELYEVNRSSGLGITIVTTDEICLFSKRHFTKVNGDNNE